ncbi:MAG: SRPBCC family protein [Acidimicrobiia bacterium]|nr:SRPBCC family protein [Acidimicrobiia bacterium]
MTTETATMMRVDFDETVPVPVDVVYGYLRSPEDWPRLYGTFGDVRDLGDGWFAVPLPGERPDLEARMTVTRPNERAAWDLRGIFTGRGEVRLSESGGGTRITGLEEIDVSAFENDQELLETIDREFRAIWQIGWDRLREQAREPAAGGV